MTAENAISVKNLSKSYRMYNAPAERLKELLHPFGRKYHRDFWALKDVSFDIKKGESVGIIGRNGSGKSTLLQVLCGILRPTSGEVVVNGRISALLELGAGFNPQFTGRENVFLNGSINGISREEMEARFDEIASFADIGEFIDQPVRTYSSGMYVRLAFAVAINVNPDILIVDEALAVGDIAFQIKCMERISYMKEKGVTLLFVTHDVSAIKKVCTRACWVHMGRLMQFGGSVETADAYVDFVREEISGDKQAVPLQTRAEITAESNLPCILAFELLDCDYKATTKLTSGEKVFVRMRYAIPQGFNDNVIIGVAIHRNDDLYVCGLNTGLDAFMPNREAGEHEIILEFPSLSLTAGTYYFHAGIFHSSAMVAFDFKGYAHYFSVSAPYRAEGVVLLNHIWRHA